MISAVIALNQAIYVNERSIWLDQQPRGRRCRSKKIFCSRGSPCILCAFIGSGCVYDMNRLTWTYFLSLRECEVNLPQNTVLRCTCNSSKSRRDGVTCSSKF